jgi:MinD-like ATPase involved in chromosome partitioning or flagellar assembly
MKIITCYSYKGGVGRTLTAANFALYLAKLGFKVVAIDFDFEAPGLDSKFPQIRLKDDQRGMLDLILDFQLHGTIPEDITSYAIPVPFDATSDSPGTLQLIPAGDYLNEEYPTKLNKLRWDSVFASEQGGIAFLRAFLALVNRDLGADFVVVDSRTGISETAGVCTQLLADEVLMLSSLSAESIKMTSHIASSIRSSSIAHSLGKRIEVKVVVTRVPRPKDIEAFRRRWQKAFGVSEDRFFMLFSSPLLESSEYLAVNEPTLSGELTSNYIELFQSLNLELARHRIKTQIEQVSKNLLSQPDKAESTVRSLVALYPSIDSYRTAMRFFVVAQQPTEVRKFAWRLLATEREDVEAHKLLVKTYIDAPITEAESRQRALQAFRWIEERRLMTPQEAVKYADLLEDDNAHQKSFEVATRVMDDETLGTDQRFMAKMIAIRTAQKLQKRDVAIQLALQIPRDKLAGSAGAILVEHYAERGDFQNALEVGSFVLRQSPSRTVVQRLSKIIARTPQLNKLQRMVQEAEVGIDAAYYYHNQPGQEILRRPFTAPQDDASPDGMP